MVVAVLLKQFVEQVQDMEFNRSLQVVVGDSEVVPSNRARSRRCC
jgi:hypothetical protein